MRSPKALVACAVLLAATVLVAEPFAASPRGQLKTKAAQAQQVLQQVNALDVQFGRTVEAWYGARYELDRARMLCARWISRRKAPSRRYWTSKPGPRQRARTTRVSGNS